MSKPPGGGNSSAGSTFASTVKTFVVVAVKAVKIGLLPVVFVWRLLRVIMGLYTLLVLLLVGGGVAVLASGGVDPVALVQYLSKQLLEAVLASG